MPKSSPVGMSTLRWLALVATCTVNCAAIAAPANGAALKVGAIAAREGEMESEGVSFGADAQFVINEHWSLNPTVMISLERESATRRLSDNLAGLQGRRWMGDWFVGGHFFYHARAKIEDGTAKQTAYGVAGGITAGFEKASGWGADVQIDAFENSGLKGTFRNAIRMHLTRRWR